MRLIPPTISESTKSDGERAVFEALAASGPDTAGWTVLHSFDIADHRRQLAGEIDFLCVVPGKGVLVVEVKGCHQLARHGGDWYYGHSAEPDHRGPFRQAADAMHSVRQRLAKQHPELAGVPRRGSAACFPSIDFTESSPEWHSWQIIDRRALQAQPIAQLVEGVLVQARKHLAEHHAGWLHAEKAEPTPQQCEALANLLRPDFEFFESPKSRFQRLNEEVRHYTDEQSEALDAIDTNPRIVFDGPAGTGKTLLAIEAARRAVARGRRVLLLSLNRPLGRWLQEETAGMERGVTARTLHEHLRLLAGIVPTREQRCRTEFWQDELPALALEALLERQGDGGLFDEIVLDEAQDVLRPGSPARPRLARLPARAPPRRRRRARAALVRGGRRAARAAPVRAHRASRRRLQRPARRRPQPARQRALRRRPAHRAAVAGPSRAAGQGAGGGRGRGGRRRLAESLHPQRPGPRRPALRRHQYASIYRSRVSRRLPRDHRRRRRGEPRPAVAHLHRLHARPSTGSVLLADRAGHSRAASTV